MGDPMPEMLPHYRNGSWTEPVPLPDWADGEDGETWLKRLSYEDFTKVGMSDSSYSIRAWARKDAPEYLIEFSDGNVCPMVTAATVGDALDLIAKWAPIVSAGILGDVAESIWNLDSLGFVTQIMAALELNAGAAATTASQARRRRERQRAEAERAKAAKSSGTS